MLAHSVLAFALLVLAPASEGSDRTAESATSGQTPMVLAVETARGLYTLSTGTTEFEYVRDEQGVRVHDAAGNSATLGFGVGCVGSSGAGDCRYVGPASFAASFPGVAAQELETGIRKLARPEAGRPAEPARAFATTSVACPGGGVFEISTGLGSGTCEVILAGGIVVGGRCRHDAGTPGDPADDSTSGVECSANGGRGSCTSASGSGTCIQRP